MEGWNFIILVIKLIWIIIREINIFVMILNIILWIIKLQIKCQKNTRNPNNPNKIQIYSLFSSTTPPPSQTHNQCY